MSFSGSSPIRESCGNHGTPRRRGSSWAGVQASPGLALLVPTERHGAVLDSVSTELPHVAGNLLHDVTTAVLMREHGIHRICTRDTDFHRFPFLEPVDPMVMAP